MKILNLGCGTKTGSHPFVVNIDWSILLRIRTNPLLRAMAPLLLNGDRLRRFKAIPDNLMVYDLSRGIPFPDASVDVVYHSHVLEHLDRYVAAGFIRECARVLRPGGIIRVVVPDFERVCRSYLDHVSQCEHRGDAESINCHDNWIEAILLQSVRREAFGSSQQPRIRRFIENLLLGDARKRGETHQWMYDRFNLSTLLAACGFENIIVQSFQASRILNWSQYGLDEDEAGREYKPESLYLEASKK